MFKKIVGALLFASLALADDMNICSNENSKKSNLESQIIDMINKEMCSKNCPCPASAKLTYASLGEESLNTF